MNARLLLLLLALPMLSCGPVRDDDDTAEDDDDDATSDDDDSTFNDPPVFLAAYDFAMVVFLNTPNGVYEIIEGQMDVSVSTTRFLAELVTDGGQTYEWQGTLDSNQNAFSVFGNFRPPGADTDTFFDIDGNFQGDAAGNPSQVCLTGTGEDDDPNFPDQGIRFVWYGCQLDAPPPANPPSPTYSVTSTINADLCGSWTAGTWNQTWALDGRLLRVTQFGFDGVGVVSDDGNVFRYTILENNNPGRALKVVGNFGGAGDTEATANGYCHGSKALLGGHSAVIDLDYP